MVELGDLVRREFSKLGLGLALAATALIAVPATSVAQKPETAYVQAAQETQIKSLKEIPGLSFQIKPWKPVNITKEVKAALKGKKVLIFEHPFSQMRRDYFDAISPNEQWWVSSAITDNKGIVNYLVGIKKLDKYDHTYLFDSKSRRIYTLFLGDKKVVGFTPMDSRYPYDVADNGTSMYYVYHPKVSEKNTMIIADFSNSRKIVIGHTNKGLISAPIVKLSGDGKRAGVIDNGDLSVVDLDTLNVIYHQKKDKDASIMAMSYDGSVIAYHEPGFYMRTDIRDKETTEMFRQDRTMQGFRFSPDGNFSSCWVQNFGPSYVNVYVHSTDERFSIVLKGTDYPQQVYNDGTIVADSGVYQYKDGTYHWATKGKKEPKELKIEKF